MEIILPQYSCRFLFENRGRLFILLKQIYLYQEISVPFDFSVGLADFLPSGFKLSFYEN